MSAPRLRLFGSRPAFREMRLSGFVVRQRIGSSRVEVTAPDGHVVNVVAHLTAGNVSQIILESGRPPAGKDETK